MLHPPRTRQAKSPHEAIFVYRDNELRAVRSGQWKLHLNLPPAKGATGPPKPALYHLETDIGEKNDVYAQHPEVVARLRSLAKEFQEDLAKNNRPAAFVENPKPLTRKSKQ